MNKLRQFPPSRGWDLGEGDRPPPSKLPHQGGGIYLGHVMHRYQSIIAYPAKEEGEQIIVEIGPGRGDFLFHLAEKNPDKRVYGIEIKGKRFDKLVARRDKRKLKNIRLFLADASFAIPRLFDESAVGELHINFPDPWPKKRHKNKRLLSPEFLSACAHALNPGGKLFITTDAEWYAKEVFQICKGLSGLRPAYESVTTESPEAYSTLFSQKWKKQGRTIYYQKHVKNEQGGIVTI